MKKDIFNKKAMQALVMRVAGKSYREIIEPEYAPAKDGCDFYEVSEREGKIIIKANNGISFARGFNEYLRKCCGYSIGILSTSGKLPLTPPGVDGVLKSKSSFRYRYFFNYCTFSYTYAYDNWADWEKTLDYLMLSGYNLILNPVGLEGVWKQVLEKLGYKKEDVEKFICGPSFYAWQWMHNLSGWGGGAPGEWYDFRIKLAGKINNRLQSMGAEIVAPGYIGQVPDDFENYFPESAVVRQGEWFGFTRPGFIMPDDPNYEKISGLFYGELLKIKGGELISYFSADPFHEGGRREGIDIKSFALKNFNRMRDFSKEAVWVLQEWGEPKTELIECIPEGGILLLSLSADKKDINKTEMTVPWCYCAVNNFGGQDSLSGAAYESLVNPFLYLEKENSNIAGIGYMPESVNCSELMFYIYAENSFGSKQENIKDFISRYAKERYGSENERIINTLSEVFNKVYSVKENYGNESGLCARPSREVKRVSSWARECLPYLNQSVLLEFTEAMLSEYENLENYGGYRNDLLQAARQLINNLSWYFIEMIKISIENKDADSLSENGRELLSLFDLQPALVGTDKSHLLGTWLEKAKRFGKNSSEKAYFEWNARIQITLWGDKGESSDWLRDYAAREWQGMLEDFYKPRWERFISRYEMAIRSGKEPEKWSPYNEEIGFAYEKKKYPVRPHGDLKKAVENIIEKINNTKFESIEYEGAIYSLEDNVVDAL